MKEKFKINKEFIQYALLLILIYLLVILKVDDFHMRYWDESMFAVNTYEMLHNEIWFSLYFDGRPDLFNTKPPLMSWLQLVFVKFIGYNELAIRLPSVIATSGTILLLFRFISKHFSYLFAWLSVLVLLTSYGFIGLHTARTGDSDAVLTFFLLWSNLLLVSYLIDNQRATIILYFLALSFAFATKLYAAFLFIPAHLILLVHYNQFLNVLKSKSFYLGLTILGMSIFGLLILREMDSPGYLLEIWNKDAGRLIVEIESHSKPFLYYLDNFFSSRFPIWISLFFIGAVLVIKNDSNDRKKLILFSLLIMTIVYLTIISLSKTKLPWYDMPLYPFLAVISGYSLWFVLKKIDIIQSKGFDLKLVILILAFFSYPLCLMFNKSQANVTDYSDAKIEANEIYLFTRIKQGVDLDNINVYYHGWNGSLLFYKYKLAESNQTIHLCRDKTKFNKNDKVLVSKENLVEKLETTYDLELLDEYRTAKLYLIK